MTYESTLAVARIIQRCDTPAADVLSCRHEVTWPDGSRIGLHPVRQASPDAQYLRAVHHDGHWVLFDLRQLTPKVARELPTAQLRDHPGLVMYGLRATFYSARAFLDHAHLASLAIWPGVDRPAEPRPSHNADHSAKAGPSPITQGA